MDNDFWGFATLLHNREVFGPITTLPTTFNVYQTRFTLTIKIGDDIQTKITTPGRFAFLNSRIL